MHTTQRKSRDSERNGDAALYTHPGTDQLLTAQYAYQLYCYSYQRRIKDEERCDLFRHFTKFARSQYDRPNSIVLKDFCTSGIDMMISKEDTGENRIKTTLVSAKEFYKGEHRDIIYFCHGAGPRRQAVTMRALLSFRMGLTLETCLYAKFDKTTLPDITEDLFVHVEDVCETVDGGDSTHTGQCYMRFDARNVKGAVTTEDMIILQSSR